jgi:hypothetical protein
MTTVINNPGQGEGSAMGWIIGVVIAIILFYVFFAYALPAMQGAAPADNGGANINVTLPAGSNGGAAE